MIIFFSIVVKQLNLLKRRSQVLTVYYYLRIDVVERVFGKTTQISGSSYPSFHWKRAVRIFVIYINESIMSKILLKVSDWMEVMFGIYTFVFWWCNCCVKNASRFYVWRCSVKWNRKMATVTNMFFYIFSRWQWLIHHYLAEPIDDLTRMCLTVIFREWEFFIRRRVSIELISWGTGNKKVRVWGVGEDNLLKLTQTPTPSSRLTYQ